jgi:LPXTG-site transpeptidase (sortase) family protein
MHFQRSRPLDWQDLVLAAAVLVFMFSVSGLVTTALAGGHGLPGFARYDDVTVRLAPDAALVPEFTPEPTVIERLAAPVVSMSIPSISLVAPLVPMGVRPDGYMDLPNSPHDVAWYQFTSKPGMGGNAVFSAHVDYINYGPAVFWNLSKVRPGDGVSIRLRDGSVVRYVVASAVTVPLEQLDVASAIAPTEQESITLITCGGDFAAGNYSHRVIVHAVRTGAQRGS